MKIWLDAQLSPSLARWMTDTFGVEVTPVREHGLRDGSDASIFTAARGAGAVVMTKDRDFVALVAERGAPPQIELLEAGEPLVEISDDPTRRFPAESG